MNYGEVAYAGSICRPPMEQGAFILPVEDGCSHNQCSFCHFYKNVPFRLISLAEVESELRRIQALSGRGPQRIFLGGGDALALPAEHLLAILGLIRRYFPGCREITADATVSDIRRKSDAELRRLADSGLGCLYVGLECGLDPVLSHLHKDHDTDQAIKQLSRLNALNLPHGAHLMTGAGGRGTARANGLATAELINRVQPCAIINVSMFIDRRAPLYRELASGAFIPASREEHLVEERTLIEHLRLPLRYDGWQITSELRLLGELPRHRERLLHRLDLAIAACAEHPEPASIIPRCGDHRLVSEAFDRA
jgi:hypothetical protein